MDEKKITRNLVNFAFKDMIDEELEIKEHKVKEIEKYASAYTDGNFEYD